MGTECTLQEGRKGVVEGDNTSKGNSIQLLPQLFVSSSVFLFVRSSSPLWLLRKGWKIHFEDSEQLEGHHQAGKQHGSAVECQGERAGVYRTKSLSVGG